jgi:hypothetical protein
MYQYKNPSVSQTTNTRINIKIRETLNESRVQIYTLVDNGQLQISGFSVNIAFGLEHTLINEYNPEWNLMGRLTQLNNIVVQPVDQVNFGIRLVQTYKTQGFINIPVAYEEYFGMDNDIINVRFNNQIFEGNINRRSNNGYPRIYVGPVLSNWLSQFELDTTISINLYDGILNLEIRN